MLLFSRHFPQCMLCRYTLLHIMHFFHTNSAYMPICMYINTRLNNGILSLLMYILYDCDQLQLNCLSSLVLEHFVLYCIVAGSNPTGSSFFPSKKIDLGYCIELLCAFRYTLNIISRVCVCVCVCACVCVGVETYRLGMAGSY